MNNQLATETVRYANILCALILACACQNNAVAQNTLKRQKGEFGFRAPGPQAAAELSEPEIARKFSVEVRSTMQGGSKYTTALRKLVTESLEKNGNELAAKDEAPEFVVVANLATTVVKRPSSTPGIHLGVPYFLEVYICDPEKKYSAAYGVERGYKSSTIEGKKRVDNTAVVSGVLSQTELVSILQFISVQLGKDRALFATGARLLTSDLSDRHLRALQLRPDRGSPKKRVFVEIKGGRTALEFGYPFLTFDLAKHAHENGFELSPVPDNADLKVTVNWGHKPHSFILGAPVVRREGGSTVISTVTVYDQWGVPIPSGQKGHRLTATIKGIAPNAGAVFSTKYDVETPPIVEGNDLLAATWTAWKESPDTASMHDRISEYLQH